MAPVRSPFRALIALTLLACTGNGISIPGQVTSKESIGGDGALHYYDPLDTFDPLQDANYGFARGAATATYREGAPRLPITLDGAALANPKTGAVSPENAGYFTWTWSFQTKEEVTPDSNGAFKLAWVRQSSQGTQASKDQVTYHYACDITALDAKHPQAILKQFSGRVIDAFHLWCNRDCTAAWRVHIAGSTPGHFETAWTSTNAPCVPDDTGGGGTVIPDPGNGDPGNGDPGNGDPGNGDPGNGDPGAGTVDVGVGQNGDSCQGIGAKPCDPNDAHRLTCWGDSHCRAFCPDAPGSGNEGDHCDVPSDCGSGTTCDAQAAACSAGCWFDCQCPGGQICDSDGTNVGRCVPSASSDSSEP